jgi:16S rRNA A1518/A1519 N6-dimethyltransferase RsmA/KsgA/DIM1 with predicted DNA glycosylase/AP lyase activity
MKGAGGLLASPIPATILEDAAEKAGDDGVVMVDIGGGIGQVTEKTMEVLPSVKGRFVVQDLGKIIEEAKSKKPKFEVAAYDFFTAQPVKGMCPCPRGLFSFSFTPC